VKLPPEFANASSSSTTVSKNRIEKKNRNQTEEVANNKKIGTKLVIKSY
jgi:hypothetical protein